MSMMTGPSAVFVRFGSSPLVLKRPPETRPNDPFPRKNTRPVLCCIAGSEEARQVPLSGPKRDRRNDGV